MSSKAKEISPKRKKSIIISAVILIIAAVASIFTAVNYDKLYIRTVYFIIPKSVVTTTNNGDMEFHLELKDDFSVQAKNKDPFGAFNYFYYDKDGNRIDIDESGAYFDGKDEISMSILFGFKLAEKFAKIKSVATKVFWATAAVAFVSAIVIWFVVWSKKQDEEKEKRYKNSQKKKRRKR